MREIIEIALGEFGTREIVGKKNNPEVLKYFKEIGHSWVKDDQVAWCSAFANWVIQTTNKEFNFSLEMSGKLNARSWLEVGRKVENPKQGDVVVLWRESKKSWKGHVGFFIRQTKHHIYVLGGNQGNKVSIQAYRKNRLLEYREL